jgi:thiamine monophosphate kinase
MNAPLSPNEFEILGHQIAGVMQQLEDMTHLFESRLGAGTELAVTGELGKSAQGWRITFTNRSELVTVKQARVTQPPQYQ